MKKFNFDGEIASSKSLLNRMLVIQSFSPHLTVNGESHCDDVVYMKSGLKQLFLGHSPIDCGAAGTTFRFLALRASRIPGKHFLVGSTKLLNRPQSALFDLINGLGVRAQKTDSGWMLEGDGWKKPTLPLIIDRSQSSQFASGILLSSWDLDFDLELELSNVNEAPSEGYFEMTKKVLLDSGMKLKCNSTKILVPKNSSVIANSLTAESDLSSAFAIAALAVISGGKAQFHSYPKNSLQPDALFPQILSKMGVCVTELSNGNLCLERTQDLKPIEQNLRNCPDLFPVLSVLCAFAKGTSTLYGAPHLVHKESSRIESTANLLLHLGCDFKQRHDGLEINGPTFISRKFFEFDPQQDHRLAMAATVARLGGAQLKLLNPHVVNKSCPEFWDLLERGLK